MSTNSTEFEIRIRFPGRAAALSLLILAGCATAETDTGEGQDPEIASSVAAPQVVEGPVGATETSKAEPGLVDAADVAELTYLPPEEPVIDDDPERLIGLGTQGLSALLGKPELIRRETPAQVWQYRGLDCVFDIFLYRKDDNDSVTYVEARDSQGNKTESRPCLNELLRARLSS